MSGFGINDKVLSSTPNTELLSSSGFGTTDKVISNVIGKSVTTNEPIKTNWFESTFPSLFDKKQSGVDYVFGKDEKGYQRWRYTARLTTNTQ